MLLRGAAPLPCAAFAPGGEAHLHQHVLHMQFTKAETRMAVRPCLSEYGHSKYSVAVHRLTTTTP